MYKCKKCDSEFETRHSLAAHYSSAHTQRPRKERVIVSKICKKCGSIFHVTCKVGHENQTVSYCSKKCSHSRVNKKLKKLIHCCSCNKLTLAGLAANKIKCDECKRAQTEVHCYVCNKSFLRFNDALRKDRKRFCSRKCLSTYIGHFGGLKSSTVNVKRSKNEIMFFNLCNSKFVDVLHNVNMFNGWDADIILKNQKIAILWNGMWHYK
jgi:hypothetical protein